jgi:hypothetical protein
LEIRLEAILRSWEGHVGPTGYISLIYSPDPSVMCAWMMHKKLIVTMLLYEKIPKYIRV